MARNFKELQRMALDDLRNAKHLTQTDMAEMLDVPQSSISRMEPRADMHLSTLRNYVHAIGGVLRIQAVFPGEGTVVIDRFGEFEDQPCVVRARAAGHGTYRLEAQPLDRGVPLSTRVLKAQAFTKTLKALHVAEPQIATLRKNLKKSGSTEIAGASARRIFSVPDLISAGFQATSTRPSSDRHRP